MESDGVPNGEKEGMSSVTIVQIVFFLLICIFGLLANLVVMFIVLVLQEFKKSVTHWYVLQLAIADFSLLLTLPSQVSERINNSWIYPVWMCKGRNALLLINGFSSIMFLTVMSIDRYIAVCHNFSDKLQKLRKQKSAFIISVCVWIIAILVAIPVMIFSTTIGTEPNCHCVFGLPKVRNVTAECVERALPQEEYEKIDPTITFHSRDSVIRFGNRSGGRVETTGRGLTAEKIINQSDKEFANLNFNINGSNGDLADYPPPECDNSDPRTGWRIYVTINFFVLFLLPILVMCVCYGLIVVRFRATKMKEANPNSDKAKVRADVDRRRITIMCATLVVTFTACWFPFYAVQHATFRGITMANGWRTPCIILTAVSYILVFLNSALNPYLYTFLGTGFSRKLKSLKSAPVLRPLMTVLVVKEKPQRIIEKTGQYVKASKETGRSSNEHQVAITQNPSVVVVEEIVQRVDEG